MVVEIIPLLLCGFADFLMEDIPVRERALVLAVVGALLSAAAVYLLASKAFQDFAVVFALSGAIPGVVCCLIAGRLPRSEQAQRYREP
jgi:energy-converting hydrogenase Eha subunit C